MGVLENPVMVSIELTLIQDAIKIIGSAIHRHFSHDEITSVQQKIIKQAQDSIQEKKDAA